MARLKVMKVIKLFLLVSVILLLSCKKETNEINSCKAYASIISPSCFAVVDSNTSMYFLDDAKGLSYIEISENVDHLGYNRTRLDIGTTYFFLSKLSAIYNVALNDTATLHNMIFKYQIHQGPRVDLNYFTISFMDSSQLKEELLIKPGRTSNPLLNELYVDYGFTEIVENTWSGRISMIGEQSVNISHVIRNLMASPEISDVHPNYYFIDGSSITHVKFSEYDEFIFSFAWGDCLSGCIYRHYWKIHVNNSCQVSLVDEYGHSLPW